MITKALFFTTLLFLSSCALPEDKEQVAIVPDTPSNHLQTTGSYEATHKKNDEPLLIKPAAKIRKPTGIYQAMLPIHGKMEQTVAFYHDFTYQLQEAYHLPTKDSVVLTAGNWAPSDGFIWLYKDQVVRERYQWKGDTLQNFNPVTRKSFSMNSMPDAMDNKTWQKKRKEGVLFFGVGNEPFWSVEYRKDSVSFLMSEWTHPLQLKMTDVITNEDSVSYSAQNDSTNIHITVFPYFCNDGMSDFVYRNKVRVIYNNQQYNGCGIVYKK